MNIITAVYNFLWGDLITLPLPGGSSIGISLLVLLLVPAGIYFTIRTRFVLIRKFPHMIQIAMEKNEHSQAGSISGFQALIVATATRVGMGNLVGVVAAISAGGAGAVFWMWLLALLGSSTAFAEGTLAQIYRQKDPLYGGYRGGPAYYIHDFMTKKKTKKQNGPAKEKRYSLIAVLFAISGLICWCGISQVISNSVSSAMKNAFHIPPLYTTIFLVVVAAIVVLRKNATVHVLDVVVPIMAGCYLLITLFVILKNIGALPSVFQRIFEEAFGLRQVAAGGFGAVLMNEKVAAGMGAGTHGSTFGGNPVVCAGANVVVDRMDNGFLANVNERAVQLRTGLAKLPMVKSLSGIGLMVGVEFFGDVRAADVLAACREKGLLVLTAKTRLRLLPPLTLTAHDVEKALAILNEVLSEMAQKSPEEQA